MQKFKHRLTIQTSTSITYYCIYFFIKIYCKRNPFRQLRSAVKTKVLGLYVHQIKISMSMPSVIHNFYKGCSNFMLADI